MANEDQTSKSEFEGVDYREETDIAKTHSAVAREMDEPGHASVDLPMWLLVVIGLVLCFGGAYLGQTSGNFDFDTIFAGGPGYQSPPPPAGLGVEVVEKTLLQIGEDVFKQHCVACHTAAGTGIPGQFPTLVDSEWVTGSTERLAAVLLNGLAGPIKVKGALYNGAMPAWKTKLTDKKIAGVLTYIRSSWGNEASEVVPEMIAFAREKFNARSKEWTEAELLQIPADAMLPGPPEPEEEASTEGDETSGDGEEPPAKKENPPA